MATVCGDTRDATPATMASFLKSKFSGGSIDKKDPVSSVSVDSKTNLSGDVVAEGTILY